PGSSLLKPRATCPSFQTAWVSITCWTRSIIASTPTPAMHRVAEADRTSDGSVPRCCCGWSLQHDLVVIPKSTYRERIEEHAHVFDLTLSDETWQRSTRSIEPAGAPRARAHLVIPRSWDCRVLHC